MKPLSRRTVTAGALAAVTVLPIGLASNARARIEHHSRELERAMRELYGSAETLAFEPTRGMRPVVMVIGQTDGGSARRAPNSKWLYVGQDSPPQI